MADKKPIDGSLIGRITGALGNVFGSSTIFGAGNAPTPTFSEEQQDALRGRQFDFPVAINQRIQPRQGEDVTYQQLRSLADNCDILRLVIETRKDQLAKMKFSVRPIKAKQKVDQRCADIEAFMKMPDGENTWDNWLRMLLEDMFVIDAATVYPWLNNDGTPYRFEVMDGSTIKRVLDNRGRTPAPPNPAYQQVLKGIPATDYTLDELLYAPRNKRSHKVYGYSPVEQVLITVNIAIRRALYQLQFYTEGSTPDLLFQAPADWNMTQIKDFNDWWQSIMSGNTAARRRAQFVPNGVTPINTKEGVLTDKYDEWLARVICYAFSVSHAAFVAQVNRATADSAQQQALEEGLYPVMSWVKGVVDSIIWKYFGYRDLEFVWEDQESVSPDVQVKIDDTNVKNATMTINEIRAKRGDDPIEGGDVAMVLTTNGYIPITAYDDQQAAAAQAAEVAQTNAQAALEAAKNPQPQVDENGNPTDPAPTKPGKKAAKAPADEGASQTDDAKTTPNKDQGTSGKAAKAEHSDDISKNVRPVAIHRRRDDIKQNEAELKAVLSKVFGEMASAVAKQVTGLAKADDQEDDIEFAQWIGELNGGLEKYLVSTAKSGANEAYMQLAIDDPSAFSLANKDAVNWAKAQAADLVGMKYDENGNLVPNENAGMNILDSTREMIRGDVAQALEDGSTTDELASKLGDSYAFSDVRAEMIARTEIARADVQGSLILYKDSGVVESKQWITGDGCCEDCQDLNGEEVGIDEDFSDGSDGPPAHPACRCDVIPVVSQAIEEGDSE